MCLVPGLGACSPLSRRRRVGLCRTEAGRSWFYSLGPPLRDLGVWMGAVNHRKGVLLHTVPENGHPAHGLPGLPTRGSESASKLPKKQASFQPPPTKNPDQAAHCCCKLLSRCPPPGQVKGETQFPSVQFVHWVVCKHLNDTRESPTQSFPELLKTRAHRHKPLK